MKSISWDKYYCLPSIGNMMTNDKEIFIRQGNRIALVIEAAINVFSTTIHNEKFNVLDYACGNGRVALPLIYKTGFPNYCCDVDKNVISYLTDNLPKNIDLYVVPNTPPTKYLSGTFDVIYSISLFTHLPLNTQNIILEEFKRILKPKGLLLITTSGYRALRSRRDIRKMPFWSSVSDDDLEKEGMIFKSTTPPAGVIEEYGYAAHSPTWVKKFWSKEFNYLSCWESAIDSIQDLHIMSNK